MLFTDRIFILAHVGNPSTATHCNTLQHTANHLNVYCNTLQHTATIMHFMSYA